MNRRGLTSIVRFGVSVALLSFAAFGVAVAPEDVRDYTKAAEYWLRVKLSDADRATVASFAERYRRNGNTQWTENIRKQAAFWRKLEPQPARVKEEWRRRTVLLVYLSLLEQTKNDGPTTEEARFWLDRHARAHPRLGDGELPLIREVVEAAARTILWHEHYVMGKPLRPLTQEYLEASYRNFAKSWATSSEEERRQTWINAVQMSLLMADWNKLAPAERALRRQMMGGRLSPEEERLVADLNSTVNQAMKSHLVNRITTSLNGFVEREKMILGYERWNPALGRYEWKGGFSTEY